MQHDVTCQKSASRATASLPQPPSLHTSAHPRTCHSRTALLAIASSAPAPTLRRCPGFLGLCSWRWLCAGSCCLGRRPLDKSVQGALLRRRLGRSPRGQRYLLTLATVVVVIIVDKVAAHRRGEVTGEGKAEWEEECRGNTQE